MWWSKPKYTVEELERSYVLEERTRVLKERIAQMNKLIDRDPTKEAKILSKKIVEETPVEQIQAANNQRNSELEALRAKLLKR